MNFKEYHGYKVWDNGVVLGTMGGQLKGDMNSAGYLRVTLYYGGKKERISIHRLVAKLFLPNFYGKPTVNHIDEIKTNNSLYNLEWATIREQTIFRNYCSRNKSGTTGVFWLKSKSRWVASIHQSENKTKRKTFKTKEEAVAQRLAWEEEYYNLT